MQIHLELTQVILLCRLVVVPEGGFGTNTQRLVVFLGSGLTHIRIQSSECILLVVQRRNQLQHIETVILIYANLGTVLLEKEWHVRVRAHYIQVHFWLVAQLRATAGPRHEI